MTPNAAQKTLLDQQGLDADPKFIGLISFPYASYTDVRFKIHWWIKDCEERMARSLGVPRPVEAFSLDEFKDAGVHSYTTVLGSRIEFATPEKNAASFACARYAHWGIVDGRVLTEDGFVTTFILERNEERERLRCWVTLEYRHGMRKRAIASTVPRIFRLLRATPGSRVFIDEKTPLVDRQEEWRYRPRFSGVREIVEMSIRDSGAAKDAHGDDPPKLEDANRDAAHTGPTCAPYDDAVQTLRLSLQRLNRAIDLWETPESLAEPADGSAPVNPVDGGTSVSHDDGALVQGKSQVSRPENSVDRMAVEAASAEDSDVDDDFERPHARFSGGGAGVDSCPVVTSGAGTLQNTFTSPNALKESAEPAELVRVISPTTRSVALMDEFERVGAGGKRLYDRLILRHEYYFWGHGGVSAVGDFVIERLTRNQRSEGDITFTELKKGDKYQLSHYVSQRVEPVMRKLQVHETAYVKLDTPYLLRAQTSSNQLYGGWEYGTLYGETNRYGIVGVRITRRT